MRFNVTNISIILSTSKSLLWASILLFMFQSNALALEVNSNASSNNCNKPTLSISPSTATMKKGERKQFYASVNSEFPMSKIQVICPDDTISSSEISNQYKSQITDTKKAGKASDSRISWSINNRALAEVTRSGLVTVIGDSGRVTLTAKTTYNGEVLIGRAMINIAAHEEPKAVLEISPEELNLKAGDSGRLSANVYWVWPSGLKEPAIGIPNIILWESSNTQIASVTSGLVKATPLPGSVEITASTFFSGEELTANATVNVLRNTDDIPVVKIEPTTLFFNGTNQKIPISATVDGQPVHVRWSSSNPSSVDIQNGYAISNADLGSALITAELVLDVLHVPAMTTAIIAQIKSDAKPVKDEELLDLSYEVDDVWAPGSDPDYDENTPLPNGTLKLSRDYLINNPMPKPGDVLVNAGRGSIKVIEAIQYNSHIEVIGELPQLADVYNELDVDFNGESLTNYLQKVDSLSGQSPLSGESFGSVEGQPINSSVTELSSVTSNPIKCEFRVDWDTFADTAVRLKINNGVLALFTVRATLEADARAELLDFAYSMKCKIPIIKPKSLGGYPLAGWATLVPHIFVDGFVQASLETDIEDHVFESPIFSAHMGAMGGFTYANAAAELISNIDPLNLDPKMNLIDPIMGDSSVTIGAKTGVDGGLVLSFVPGTWPVTPGTDWTKLSLVDVKAPVQRLSIGRKVTVPSYFILDQGHESYKGMEGTDTIENVIFIIREVSPGGLIKFVLKALGVEDSVSIVNSDPEIKIIDINNTWPQISDLKTSSHKVYVGGFEEGHPLYDSYPGSIDLEAVISTWDDQFILDWADPWTHMEIWTRDSGTGLFSEMASAGRNPRFTYTPQPGEEGLKDFRAQLYYLPFLNSIYSLFKPAVSPDIQIEVATMSDLIITPNPVEQTLFPGTQESTEISVSNLVASEASYVFEETYDWLIAPSGAFTVPENTSKIHNLEFSCPDSIVDYEGKLTLRNTTTNDTSDVDVSLSCRALIINPNSMSLSASVGQTAVANFSVKNNVNQDVVTSNSINGFTVTPISSTIPADSWASITGTRKCTAKGSSQHTLNIIAYGYSHTVPITLECKDPGQSSGDPHLYSFDRVKFDFQAKGEFVLSRWENDNNEFEVQARQVEWGTRSVTVNSAIAMNVHGDRLGFYDSSQIPTSGSNIMLNGNPTSLTIGEQLALPNSSSTLTRINENSYRVIWENGADGTVSFARGHLNLSLTPPQINTGELVGVLGNFNGNPTDDFKLRDGTLLPSPPGFNELYNCQAFDCFAYHEQQGWLIRTETESLFDYNHNEGPLDFAPEPGQFFPHTVYDVNDFDMEQRNWAEEVCRNAGVVSSELLESCMLDLLLTSDPGFALSIADMETSETSPTTHTYSRSCKELRDSGITSNGFYEIDTDGDGPIPVVQVYCDMTTGEGGWTFLQITNGTRTYKNGDSNSCKDVGLELFAPRSRDDFILAREFANNQGHSTNLGPLGIYHSKPQDSAAEEIPMNSYAPVNAAQRDWVSTAGQDWWASDLTTIPEPNGDYQEDCWLLWEYNGPDGDVSHYNDYYCNYSYIEYMCMHQDNLSLDHNGNDS